MADLVLVTGASGNLGRHVLDALKKAGYDVRAQYSRRPGQRDDVEWRRMDFFEDPDFAALVDGCAAVVHLAAELRDPKRMDRVNVEATRALALASAHAGVRYLGYASSIVVYGSPRRRKVDESTPRIDPRLPIFPQYYAEPYMLDYARTKALAEEALEALGLDINIDLYRPSVVADQERIRETAKWGWKKRSVTIRRKTQFIYAQDAAAAIVHLVSYGLAGKERERKVEAFNICDEDCGRYSDLNKALFAKTGDARYRTVVYSPVPIDPFRDALRARKLRPRRSLGALEISNRKLRGTGFLVPTGVFRAAELATDR